MATVSESGELGAPPEAVFDLLADPDAFASLAPSLETFRAEEAGDRRYVYRAAGVTLTGTISVTGADSPDRMHWQVDGDVEGGLQWVLTDDDGTTRFACTGELSVDLPGEDRDLRPLVRRYNKRELRALVNNLRTRFER